MIIKNGVAITSGYTVDKKIFMESKVLVSSYFLTYMNRNVFNLNHDNSQILGYVQLNTLLFFKGITYQTIVHFICETEDEFRYLEELGKENSVKQVNEVKDDFIILEKKLSKHLTNEYKKVPTSSVAIFDKDILLRVFPELKGDLKHNLVDIRLLKPEKYNHFSYKGYLVYPHCFLRRSQFLRNSFNEEFIILLKKMNEDSKLDIKIALDNSLIGLLGTEQKDIELQFWWGPKFSENLEEIHYGVSVHKMPEREKLFNRIDKTEFFWYKQDDVSVLEIEEIITYKIEYDEHEIYPSRFIHSMLNEDYKPIHIDGAIRGYTFEKYTERISSSIDKFGRDSIYRKLWRIDGELSIPAWKNLITQYYRDNMLIGEYFGGVDDIYKNYTKDKPDSKKPDYSQKFGVIFAFKIISHLICEDEDYDFSVSFPNTSKLPKELKISNLEWFIKLVDKLKQSRVVRPLALCDDLHALFEDTPLILCKNKTFASEIVKMLNHEIYDISANISYAVGTIYDDKIAVIAFMGESTELTNILNQINIIPNELNDYENVLLKINEKIENISVKVEYKPFDLLIRKT